MVVPIFNCTVVNADEDVPVIEIGVLVTVELLLGVVMEIVAA